MNIIKSILLSLLLIAALSLEARAAAIGGLELPKPTTSADCGAED